MKQWRIGIIGCGGIAGFHIQAIREIGHAKLIAVSSRSRDKAETIGKQENCDWTDDYKELLDRRDIDLVSVTTSSGSHYTIGREALLAGKHLVIEKPMAMLETEAAELIAIAEANGLTISVISQRRFEPQHQLLKRLMEQNKLGNLLFAEVSVPYYRSQDYYDSAAWRGTIQEDGGSLMNQGIHSIDLLLWLVGQPVAVSGKIATQSHQIEAEDMGVAIVTFAGGAIGTIMASTNIKPGFPAGINLYGDKGTVKVSGSDIIHWSVEGMDEPELGLTGQSGGVSDPLSIQHIYHQLQYEDILDALASSREPLVTGRDGMASVQLIRKIYESSKLGREMRLDEPSTDIRRDS
ncbi:Gfo/Idh/MocA family protein [Paenibacillus nasutitermitis]|uniref:Oxidoreductase n=1 Tax=Paenibacillus nasutitermitis TaxID=1652958 RepID=A0A916YQP3_9BACL|nr:Gfo/Idh/MocA family oxidoreductase [Paenibacillus nasutitermitis]GGD56736.1 oxidoreductase [Paenibacillus nasutitermitis]